MSFSEIPDTLDESVVEGLLRGTPMALEPALTAFVRDVRQLQHVPAPPPSAALASLLTHGFAVATGAAVPPRARGRWRRRVAGIAGVCAAVSATLVSAAAAQALPPSAQHVVAGIVDRVTPFTVPDSPAHAKVPRAKHHPAVTTTEAVPSAPAPSRPVAGPAPVSRLTTPPRLPAAQQPAAQSPAPPVHRVAPPLPARPTSRGRDDGAKPQPSGGDGPGAHEPSHRGPRPTETPGSQRSKGSGGGDDPSGHGKGSGGGGDRNGRGGHSDG